MTRGNGAVVKSEEGREAAVASPRRRRRVVAGLGVVTLAAATATLVAVLAPTAQATPDGVFDPTYGTDGVGGGFAGEGVSSGTVDSTGRALVVSSVVTEGPPEFRLRRLTASGALDATFAGGSLTLPYWPAAIAADAGGSVLIAGSVEGTGVVVTKYTSAGGLDGTFGTGGSVTAVVTDSGFVWNLVIRPSGLLVAATLANFPDPVEHRIVALTASGDVDETWGDLGVLTLPEVPNSIAADGDALVVRTSDTATFEPVLVRYSSTGVLDDDFAGDGVFEIPTFTPATDVAVSGGAYYLYGTYVDPDLFETAMGVAKLSATGELDESFGVDGTAHGLTDSLSGFNSVRMNTAGGFIYLSGDRCCGTTPIRVSRFDADGTLDTGYGADGEALIDEVDGLAAFGLALGVQPSGQLLFAFEGSEPGASEYDPTTGVFRLLTDIAYPDIWAAGAFVSLSPVRLLDTRVGTGAPVGKVAANGIVELQVAGAGGVPAEGAAAVVLNVTVTGPTKGGFITAFPTGEPVPTASNLNFVAGQTIPNLVTVKLGADGKVSLKNGSAGLTHLVADVAGYYLDGVPLLPGTFVPLSPSRLLDTRVGTGAPMSKVAANGIVELQVAGVGGVPEFGAIAVVLNVTVTAPTKGGFITAFPTGELVPTASNLNFVAGQTIPNLVTVKLGTDGKVSLKNGSAGLTHLVADVAGYYLDGTPTESGTFVALSPVRLLDTRVGTGAPVGKVAANGIVELPVAGVGGVPADGAAAAVLNVTVTGPTKGGFITAFPTGELVPTASNLNFVAGQTIPNLVAVKLGTDGKVSLKNGSAGLTHLVADVAGYFRS
jgi:uncharacterized delta-60 repeat protein